LATWPKTTSACAALTARASAVGPDGHPQQDDKRPKIDHQVTGVHRKPCGISKDCVVGHVQRERCEQDRGHRLFRFAALAGREHHGEGQENAR
jgi:hypothetical protein